MDRIRRCHRCGGEILSGAFCRDCTMELAMGLRNANYEDRNQNLAIHSSQREPMEGRMRFIGTPRRKGDFLCI